MSQTNTNTNTRVGNTNKNQINGRGGRGSEGPSGKGLGSCGENYRNILIAKYLSEGNMKDGCISKHNYQNRALSHSIQEDY